MNARVVSLGAHARGHALAELLDHPDWQLEGRTSQVTVYARTDVADSGVVGFKTVVELVAEPDAVLALLSDVVGAMAAFNPWFHSGEVLEQTDDGALVRTAFSLPWPIGPREFVHELHTVQVDADTWMVVYTPADREDIPRLEGFHRCETALSGQRVTRTARGVRVEHGMTYALGGRITKDFQDRWILRSHVRAYQREWQAFLDHFVPLPREAVDEAALVQWGQAALEASTSWPEVSRREGGSVQVGTLTTCPRKVVRTTLLVDAEVSTVVDMLADRSLAWLPSWNVEFREGRILGTVARDAQHASWTMHVRYGTPWPLQDRDYVYAFTRTWVGPDEAVICYQSVAHDEVDGVQRAILHPSVHRVRKVGGRTEITHLLATDLCGALGPLQDRLLTRSLVEAHHRDMASQLRLFTEV